MKKATALSLLFLLALTTPVFASPGTSNGKSQEHKKQPTQQVLADEVSPTVTVTPSVTVTPTDVPSLTPTTAPTQQVLGECDASASWKNHGKYVSCVAKQHLGGAVTSAAARSDVGKKNQSVTPTVTITPTVTATPTATVTPSVSPTPITGSEDTLSLAVNPLESVKALFANVKRFFEDLI